MNTVSKTPHLQRLTGLRGLAAWIVVLYHLRGHLEAYLPSVIINAFSKGYLAVDLFFVLSGFVIYLNYANRLQQRTVSIRSFIVRRLARIYPLHLVVLLGYICVYATILTISTQKTLPVNANFLTFIQHIFLIHSWGFNDFLSWNRPSWSISVEFMAYLLFPYLVVKVSLQKHSIFRLIIMAATLILGYRVACAVLGIEDLNDQLSRFGTLRCLTQFVLGCIACELWIRRSYSPPKTSKNDRHLALCVAGLALLAWLAGTHESIVFPLLWFCIVIALVSRVGDGAGLLTLAPLMHIGELSYATYMTHELIFIVFKAMPQIGTIPLSGVALCVLILTIMAVSQILYQWVERPAQTWIRQRFDTNMDASTSRS